MSQAKTFWSLLLMLVLLAACSGGAHPTATLPPPTATLPSSTGAPVRETPAPSSLPSPTPGSLFPQNISNEPLNVITTQPADKGTDVAVVDSRIIVQFNHPVVPLTAVEAQKNLPQPLSLQPSVPGTGQWINTSTFAFTPSQTLAVATQYTATVAPLKDMLGLSLSGYTWSFKTVSPAIVKTYPADKTQYVGTTQPITITFNTEMDRASTESRLTIQRQDTGTAVSGRIAWQGVVLSWTPDKPLEYAKPYVAELKPGAQDINRLAATPTDVKWSFRTVPPPGVSTTLPANGNTKANISGGFRVQFSSPMSHTLDTKDSLKVSISPTITNQSFYWESAKGGDSGDTAVRIVGNWLASQPYTVTISGDNLTRYGEKLGKDVVVRFTTAPRAPQLGLNVPSTMGMYDANGPQVIVATYVNLTQIDYKLFKVDRSDYIRLLGRNYYQSLQSYAPKPANQLRAWSLAPKAPLNANRLISTTLTADGTPLPSGVYFLQATTPSITKMVAKQLLIVSGMNLSLKRTETEALVWVTDLKSGQPLAGQPLTLYDTNGKVLGSGKSDKDGIWRLTFAKQNAWDPIYALSEASGQIVGAVGSDWNDGIMTWDFNMPSQPSAQEYYANLYTDRSIYRPGQSVYFKGILRRDNDATYSLPSGIETVPVTVRDAQGKRISTQNVPLSSYGTFNGEIKLTDSAAIGYYNLSIQLGQDPNRFYTSVGFQVAEYRAPEFQVAVTTDKPEYINGDTIQVDVNSTYFFGGAVSNAAVTWRLMSDDLFFQPDTVKGYWNFVDYDLTTDRMQQGQVIRQGKGKTDAAGRFHFEVPADLKDFPLSQNFTLEAEITDINNQSVSSRTTVPVHKGQYYIGLRPQRYVGTVGQEQAVDVITVDTKGLTVTNQALTVSFFEHKWYSVQEKSADGNLYWKSAYTDTLVSKMNVTTNAQGSAVATFAPSKGGVYKVVAEGQDAANNKIRSSTYLWVSGREFVNWRMENNDRIDLVADKKEYAPGDTAEILIPAPFKNAQALLTIERGTIREVRRLTLPGNSEKVQIPIRSDYSPNVFVSILLVKGRGPDSPTPQFKLGYTNLAVSTVQKQLKITVTPDKQTHYSPGEKATFAITTTDYTNTPVQTELSVALVDKAIQSLTDDMSISPLQAFYGQRGLGVQTSATLVRSVERINEQLNPEAKGGGGGPALQPVRRDFQDTAFWKADVVTDSSGNAKVTIPLPDNLTTWNLTAKGVTTSTQVGEASTDIMSTKDLLVRPVTPRFFVVGDKATLQAVVNNNTDKDVSVDVGIDGGQGLTIAGNVQQPLTVRAHDKGIVSWNTTVNPVEQVTVRFSASGNGYQDAIEQTLPVLRPISEETVATAGQVDTRVAEQIQLPSVVDKTAGDLKIELSPSLAAASRDSLDYLQSFDYDCTEQTVSKFFPNVATYLALKKLGIDRPDLRSSLETNVTTAVQRLYALQRQDGGWGWWANDDSQPTLTAYALLALYDARQAGFAVDTDVMNRAEQFLTRYLDQPLDVKIGYAANERAFTIFVLTEMGRPMTGRAVNLYDQRANLANYGKAFLMMSLLKLKQPQAQSLQTELTSAAIQSATGTHWEESKPDYWTMNTNTRSTALAIMALSRASQGAPSPILSNAVRWLMVARKEGHWETTQETAWSVLALTEFMQSTGELQGNYTYQVSLNGKAIGDGTVDKTNIDQSKTLTVAIKDLVQTAANEVLITRSTGDGRLYYSAYLHYYLPVENMPALNRGILIGRQYEAVDPQTLKPTGKLIQSAKVGDYVQVTLTIVAPQDLHYLVLEDPLPAGFEAVDTTLKTSSAAAQGPQLQAKQPAEQTAYGRWFQPYWTYWAHSEVRDDKIAAFATYLGRGTYEYSYMMRASVLGQFQTLPARAYEMYFPDVFGRSAGTTFVVNP